MRDILFTARRNYPHYILDVQVIGKSVENRDILALAMGEQNSSILDKSDSDSDQTYHQTNAEKSSILFTGKLHHKYFPENYNIFNHLQKGLHHARELFSVSQSLFIMFKILHQALNEQKRL